MEKIRILVIDDKKIIGDLFAFTLGYSGHEITVADHAAAALEAVKNKEFDIAFIDIVMPGKDGVAIFKEIQAIVPKLPVVMMSGYSVEDKRNKARDLGAITCLKKPFEMEDVKRVIKVAIGKEV